MTKPTIGKPEVNRRTFLYAAGATAIGAAGWEAGRRTDATASAPADATAAAGHHHHATVDRVFRYPEGDPAYGQLAGRRPQSVHKSASQMTRQEIRRFSRAYRWAVAKGYFDVFNDEHFNAQRNRHHGADVLAVAPPAVFPGETPEWGYRLLPWHRSFIIEGEAMLKAALADRNRHERRDPKEADLLFLPYWDATHEQDLPRWVKRLRPRGGTAIVPEGLPPAITSIPPHRRRPARPAAKPRSGQPQPARFAHAIPTIGEHDRWVDHHLPAARCRARSGFPWPRPAVQLGRRLLTGRPARPGTSPRRARQAPSPSAVTSNSVRDLIACTREMPSLTGDRDLQTAHSPQLNDGTLSSPPRPLRAVTKTAGCLSPRSTLTHAPARPVTAA
jgi:hypothetical protein